ncbi:MAG: hypothetical protein MRERV_3c017 [Mycoplasmataceae bacterium RV_VA103A]|nr:MAG: hypothetical protein MRERV_3c017 [Mycoplasmataceae bacterium RV_VA103A]
MPIGGGPILLIVIAVVAVVSIVSFIVLNSSKESSNEIKVDANTEKNEKRDERIRNIIIGKTGNGKSALSDVLVGEQKFKEVAGSTSGTQRSQKEIFEWKEISIR